MIKLTRLNGEPFVVNEELIETIEETPDTVVTLTNGHRYLVGEKIDAIINAAIAFRARIERLGRRQTWTQQ